MTHIYIGSWLGLVVVAFQSLICKCCIIVPSDNLLLSTRPICWKYELYNLTSSFSWGSSALRVLETSSYKNSEMRKKAYITDINLCHVNIKHELPLAWIVAAASLTLGFCISLESSKTSASLSSLLPICSRSTFVTWQTIKVS